MRTPHQQRGMTMIGWVLVLLMIAFFTTLVLRLAPIYLENYQIKTILSSFDEEPELYQMSKKDVRQKLWSLFYTNSIAAVSTQKKEDKDKIKIVKRENTLTIDVNYTVQQHMFYNIDVLISFTNHYETVFH